MSCTREMRPTPMAPTLICLLGAYWPKTDDGTMVGKPATAAAPAAVFRNLRLEIPLLARLVMASAPYASEV